MRKHLRSKNLGGRQWLTACSVLSMLTLCGCGAVGTGSSTTSSPSSSSASTPVAPTDLRAAGGNSQVALTWVASTGASSYHVERATVSGGPYVDIGSPTASSYTDTGVTNGTAYYYVVVAVNSAGDSVASAQASAMPDAATAAPSVPSGLLASAGNAQVGLTWTVSAGAGSYHVKRATVSGGPFTVIATATSASYIDTGLADGSAYYYVVSALNSAGESANSTQVSATPRRRPRPGRLPYV